MFQGRSLPRHGGGFSTFPGLGFIEMRRSDDPQKEKEKKALERVLEAFGVQPISMDSSCEAPDLEIELCVDNGKIKIGCEVTGFHSAERVAEQKSRKIFEKEWEILKGRLREIRNEKSDKEDSVLIFFKKLPYRRSHGAFCEALIAVVRNAASSLHLGESVRLRVEKIGELSAWVESLWVKRTTVFIDWEASDYIAASVGITEDDLAKIVINKSKKHYRKNDDYWLIIASDWWLSTTFYGPPLGLSIEQGTFSKIFLIDSCNDVFVFDAKGCRQWKKMS